METGFIKKPLLGLIISHINPIHTRINLNVILPSTCLPRDLFPLRLLTELLYKFLRSRIRTACHTHHIVLHFIILITFDEDYKLSKAPSCSFLHHSRIISCLVGLNTLLSTLFIRYGVSVPVRVVLLKGIRNCIISLEMTS
jgi:hypothetical protein